MTSLTGLGRYGSSRSSRFVMLCRPSQALGFLESCAACAATLAVASVARVFASWVNSQIHSLMLCSLLCLFKKALEPLPTSTRSSIAGRSRFCRWWLGGAPFGIFARRSTFAAVRALRDYSEESLSRYTDTAEREFWNMACEFTGDVKPVPWGRFLTLATGDSPLARPQRPPFEQMGLVVDPFGGGARGKF